MEAIIELIYNYLTRELVVMLTAALPIIELRGAIPVGISLELSPLKSLFLSMIGSTIPVPIILFTIRPIFNYLKSTKTFKKIIHKLTKKSISRSGKVQKYGAWGLLVFVAIPLPGTGVWSGSLIAALLNMRFKWAFPAIFTGNIIAGLIITIVSYGFSSLIGG